MNMHLSYILTTAACLVALACGHEATSSGAGPRGEPAVAVPVVTATVATAPVVATAAEAPASPPAPAAPAPNAATSSSATDCVEVDTELGGTHITLEGRVFVDQHFAHPSRGKTHPYILRLDAPRCAKGIDEARVAEIALASAEGVELKPLVGKHVRLSGDPFAAHTAWHARPIVLMTTTATRIP